MQTLISQALAVIILLKFPFIFSHVLYLPPLPNYLVQVLSLELDFWKLIIFELLSVLFWRQGSQFIWSINKAHIVDFLEESWFLILAHCSVCVCERVGQAFLISSYCWKDMLTVNKFPGLHFVLSIATSLFLKVHRLYRIWNNM